ncbi:recombinase family protein [Planctomycetes bacterium TBK1r]|uniref:Resolvase/invertase-type recombinase catalytic domain-containing protein n=1 Tax=Stieleria magnilauensis TaxID=2527963 RepID=A0ABX5Y0V6_9BACT|nr:hypothetical protein TBK1r_62000 [Planctomycetes bacterium TBK1r]
MDERTNRIIADRSTELKPFRTLADFEPDTPIVGYCRCSDATKQAAQLSVRLEHLPEAIEANGYRTPDAMYGELIRGFVTVGNLRRRTELKKAIEHARRIRGIVVAHSVDRFVRPGSTSDRKHNYRARPKPPHYRALMKLADGVPLATLWHPDLTPGEVKRLESEIGIRRQPGRPKKRAHLRVSNSERSLICFLSRTGESVRGISQRTGIPRPTVQRVLSAQTIADRGARLVG